jgi:predicted lipoprotein with Yx(FWY)xxD motif
MTVGVASDAGRRFDTETETAMRTHRIRILTVGGLATVVFVALAATAMAGVVSSLGVAQRTIAGKHTSIVVDRRGDTVYELGGESVANLRCVNWTCLKTFSPVLVRSASTKVPVATGVPGKISILRRPKANLYQVMLNNHPLYFYSGDTTIGATKGQGLKGPGGGTWHVVSAG